MAWSTTVVTAWVAIARVCCIAWAVALVGLQCQDRGQCRVEDWLVDTRVVRLLPYNGHLGAICMI